MTKREMFGNFQRKKYWNMYYNIVLSNSHKYLYYRVPKTATTSIIKYLEKYTTLDIGGTSCENKGYNIDYNDEWNTLFQFIFVIRIN